MKLLPLIFISAFTLFSCEGSKTENHTSKVETVSNVVSDTNVNFIDEENVVGIDCPPEGSATSTKLQSLNVLKNRTKFPRC